MSDKVKLRLKEILEQRQMTQKELSEISGLSQNAVSYLVRGTAYIRMETLEKLCTALNVTPSDLIEYEPS